MKPWIFADNKFLNQSSIVMEIKRMLWRYCLLALHYLIGRSHELMIQFSSIKFNSIALYLKSLPGIRSTLFAHLLLSILANDANFFELKILIDLNGILENQFWLEFGFRKIHYWKLYFCPIDPFWTDFNQFFSAFPDFYIHFLYFKAVCFNDHFFPTFLIFPMVG